MSIKTSLKKLQQKLSQIPDTNRPPQSIELSLEEWQEVKRLGADVSLGANEWERHMVATFTVALRKLTPAQHTALDRMHKAERTWAYFISVEQAVTVEEWEKNCKEGLY